MEVCGCRQPVSTGLLAGIAVGFTSTVAAQTVPVRVSSAWEVTVGPGELSTAGGGRTAVRETVLRVPRQAVVQVRGEKHASLPVFAEKAAPWRKGAPLKPLVTQECTAAGALVAESVSVRAVDGPAFVRGKDYLVDGSWGTIGRVEGGAIGPQQAVSVDYDYYPNRLHAIAVDAEGKARLVEGKGALGIQLPPDLGAGETRLAAIWLSGTVPRLTDANLFPVDGSEPKPSEWRGRAAELCPRTVAKLQAGQPVRIVAWGDSVTNGGGVGGDKKKWYQSVFVERLRSQYKASEITLLTAAWGGGNSRGYMSAPAGGRYDFKRDVLDPKPDLVTIEFVNDAGWRGEALDGHYGKILEILQGNGSEVILITPHFVRPDWMGVTTLKFDDDPRPYVKGLRAFARRNGVAVADASLLWGHLWREGIPYMTLEGNSINHPDLRGHRLFADALMALFAPAERQ